MIRIGEALVDVLLDAVEEGRPRVRRVIDWIADVARPPPGVRLVADDGTEYTGLVLVEANRPRLMFALRVGVSNPLAVHDARYRREPQYLRHVLDEELWRRGDDPYR